MFLYGYFRLSQAFPVLYTKDRTVGPIDLFVNFGSWKQPTSLPNDVPGFLQSDIVSLKNCAQCHLILSKFADRYLLSPGYF